MASGYHRSLGNISRGYRHGWSQRRELGQLLLLLMVGHKDIGRKIGLLIGVDRRPLLLLLEVLLLLLLLWLLILLVDTLLLRLLVLLRDKAQLLLHRLALLWHGLMLLLHGLVLLLQYRLPLLLLHLMLLQGQSGLLLIMWLLFLLQSGSRMNITAGCRTLTKFVVKEIVEGDIGVALVAGHWCLSGQAGNDAAGGVGSNTLALSSSNHNSWRRRQHR